MRTELEDTLKLNSSTKKCCKDNLLCINTASRDWHMAGPRVRRWWGQIGGFQGHMSYSINQFHTCYAHGLQLFGAVFLIFLSCPHCTRNIIALKGQLNIRVQHHNIPSHRRTAFSSWNSSNTSGMGSCILHVFHCGKKMPFKIWNQEVCGKWCSGS